MKKKKKKKDISKQFKFHGDEHSTEKPELDKQF